VCQIVQEMFERDLYTSLLQQITLSAANGTYVRNCTDILNRRKIMTSALSCLMQVSSSIHGSIVGLCMECGGLLYFLQMFGKSFL